MMEKPGDRKRSSNYTMWEKELLISLVQKYIKIIENKKTNAVFNKQKSECWEKLAWEYNANQRSGQRTGLQLKSTYEQMKKLAKQHKAEDKIELLKTGGGTFCPKVTSTDEKILCVIKENYFSIDNKFDSNGTLETDICKISTQQSSDMQEEIVIIYEEDEETPMKEESCAQLNSSLDDITNKKMNNLTANNEGAKEKTRERKRKIETQTPVKTKNRTGSIHANDSRKLEILDLKIDVLKKMKEAEIENLKGKKLDNEIKEIVKEKELLDLYIKKKLIDLSSSEGPKF